MADTIRLRVVTPSRQVIDEEVDEVTAPGALGEFGVLPNHIAFLTLLEPGEMSFKQGSNRYYLAVSGGYAEVLDNVMTILATAAEFPDEIDADLARSAGHEAERRIDELLQEGKEPTDAETALRWAGVRIAVAEREARREH
jgi:F-type H+-transporting ATPase subunit epsilon